MEQSYPTHYLTYVNSMQRRICAIFVSQVSKTQYQVLIFNIKFI